MRGVGRNWRSPSWKGSAWIAASALVVLILTGAIPISAQRRVTTAAARRSASPVFRTIAQLMADQAVRGRVPPRPLLRPEFHRPDRRGLPQNPAPGHSPSLPAPSPPPPPPPPA